MILNFNRSSSADVQDDTKKREEKKRLQLKK